MNTAHAPLKVGIGGLGSIGSEVARALDRGIAGLELCAVSAQHPDKARKTLASFSVKPCLVALPDLAERVDVVIECAPADVYDQIASPAIEAGRTLISLSSGALLSRPDLVDRARQTGARILVPSGGILGLDALRAVAESAIHSVVLTTRKPPSSLADAPCLLERGISLTNLREPLCVFSGNAREAVRAFPANANVAATLSLAGIGADRTQVEMWADPSLTRNVQTVQVRATAADFDFTLSSYPLAENPRTGSLTPKSVIATLRSLRAALCVG